MEKEKLKTLKDFEQDSCSLDSFRAVDSDDLKAEAIKLVKEKQFKASGRNPFTDKEILLDVILVDDVKHFFNQTEEDLKLQGLFFDTQEVKENV